MYRFRILPVVLLFLASQGTWVITSYAVAEAICVPLTGWLAGRFGRVQSFCHEPDSALPCFRCLCGLFHQSGNAGILPNWTRPVWRPDYAAQSNLADCVFSHRRNSRKRWACGP